MSTGDLLTLLALAALWGASFLFMRVASPAVGPVVLIDGRVVIAGLALLLYAGVTGRRPLLWPKWPQYLLLGAVNAAIPFCLIATAELTLEASTAAILNAMTPLFTAVIAHVWTHSDRLTTAKMLGLVLGVAGVAVLVDGPGGSAGSHTVLAVGLSLGAACCYAIGGVLAASGFRGEPPLTLATGQQLAAGLLLLPLAAVSPPRAIPSLGVLGAVSGLALLSTALAYLLYFRLIHRVGPVKTLSVAFLIPIFGVAWGRLFLDEPVSVNTVGGLAIILFGVALVTGVAGRLRRHPAVPSGRA